MPVQPSALDIEASVRFLESLGRHPRVRKGKLRVGLVGNRLKPNTNACGIDMVTPGISVSKHQNPMATTRPAMKPSQLFFGEIWGASLCLPIADPTK